MTSVISYYLCSGSFNIILRKHRELCMRTYTSVIEVWKEQKIVQMAFNMCQSSLMIRETLLSTSGKFTLYTYTKKDQQQHLDINNPCRQVITVSQHNSLGKTVQSNGYTMVLNPLL